MSSVSISHKSPLVTGGQVSKSPPPLVEKKSPVLIRPRWRVASAPTTNPLRRLIAAVVLQAVFDAHYTTADAPKGTAAEAREFLHSPEGDSLLRHFVGAREW